MGNMATNTIVRNGLLALGGVMMLITLYLIFIWVPTEKNLGVSQRIFYFHVPLAWTGFLAFFFVLVGSVGYLWKKTDGWDRMAYAAAEIGVVYTTLLLVTGILWSKPVWGVWWTWDPRLTTSLILWLIYVAYLMLRAYSPKGEQGARYAAVLGIAGFVDVPIVYKSIDWWRTVHPEAMVGPGSSGDLASSMLLTLLVSLATFTVIFISLLMERVSLKSSEQELEAARDLIGF
jgi:heme exporter protein C